MINCKGKLEILFYLNQMLLELQKNPNYTIAKLDLWGRCVNISIYLIKMQLKSKYHTGSVAAGLLALSNTSANLKTFSSWPQEVFSSEAIINCPFALTKTLAFLVTMTKNGCSHCGHYCCLVSTDRNLASMLFLFCPLCSSLALICCTLVLS